MKMEMTKSGISVLTNTDPRNILFSTDYGTLKYYLTGTLSVTIDVVNTDTVGWNTVTHNLGYYPYVEAFLLNTSNQYEYIPTKQGGASTTWDVNFVITSTQVKFYVVTSGFTVNPTFYFKYFIFKNDLNL
jgi:hypothetical protein